MRVNVTDLSTEAIIIVHDVVGDVHWACGKVDCDCDQATDELRDEEMRLQDECF